MTFVLGGSLFKGDPFFIIDESKVYWYTKMRNKIERIIVSRSIRNAQIILKKAPPVGREEMTSVLKSYFSHGTLDSILRFTALGTDYLAAGRPSEVQTATLNTLMYSTKYKMAGFDWRQVKTGKSKPVWFANDYSSYYNDHYFQMACFYLSGQGQEYQDMTANNWLFPSLANLADSGAARKMSNFLEDLQPSSTSVEYRNRKVPEIPEGVTSYSIRSGALGDLMYCNVSSGVIKMHGGHDDPENSKMWEYQNANPKSTLSGMIRIYVFSLFLNRWFNF